MRSDIQALVQANPELGKGIKRKAFPGMVEDLGSFLREDETVLLLYRPIELYHGDFRNVESGGWIFVTTRRVLYSSYRQGGIDFPLNAVDSARSGLLPFRWGSSLTIAARGSEYSFRMLDDRQIGSNIANQIVHAKLHS
jgi:hypothetical protein